MLLLPGILIHTLTFSMKEFIFLNFPPTQKSRSHHLLNSSLKIFRAKKPQLVLFHSVLERHSYINFRRANFCLLKELVDDVHRETVLREIEQSWQFLKKTLVKELFTSQYKKTSRRGRKPAWLNKDLVRLKDKKENYRQWKQGQVAWEEQKDAFGHAEMGLGKRKAKESAVSLIDEEGELATTDMAVTGRGTQ